MTFTQALGEKLHTPVDMACDYRGIDDLYFATVPDEEHRSKMSSIRCLLGFGEKDNFETRALFSSFFVGKQAGVSGKQGYHEQEWT